MIDKFIKIKSIGKFKNYSSTGDLHLNHFNLIYGENSSGKTTLVSVIRSLAENMPDLITERKTFNCTSEPYVELLFDDRIIHFKNNSWQKGIFDRKNIQIFDERFVFENVYTGTSVTSEHQKNLCSFALGEEQVTLAKKIEENKNQLKIKRKELSDIKKKIEKEIDGLYSVKEFVDLDMDKEIDRKIKEVERKLEMSKKSEEIKNKELLARLHLIQLNVNLEEVKEALKSKIEDISKSALIKTGKHLDKLNSVMNGNAETWLSQGMNFVESEQENICPFCQSNLEISKNVLKEYNQYFNKAFKDLCLRVNRLKQKIIDFPTEKIFHELDNTLHKNEKLIEYWKKFITNYDVPNIHNTEEIHNGILELISDLKKLFHAKSQNITESIKTNSVDDLEDGINEYNQKIELYNGEIDVNDNHILTTCDNKKITILRIK